MIPPLRFESFGDMNKKEAQEHFEWYISEAPRRIKQLKDFVDKFDLDKRVEFDYSPQSLVDLWSWYVKNVEILDKSETELANEIKSINPLIKNHIRNNKISTMWLAIALDIGIYLAECMIRNNENLKWDVLFKPKSLMCVNKPVIIGFQNDLQMDTSNLIFIQTRKILKGQKKESALIELFNNWQSQ